MSDRPFDLSDAFARIRVLEAERDRLREALRLREESQIPVVPRGAQRKIERLEERLAGVWTILESSQDDHTKVSALRRWLDSFHTRPEGNA